MDTIGIMWVGDAGLCEGCENLVVEDDDKDFAFYSCKARRVEGVRRATGVATDCPAYLEKE